MKSNAKTQSRPGPGKATECRGQLPLPAPEDKLPEPPSVLPLHSEDELSCRLPEEPGGVLTREAFSQLFGWACSTHLEICCLGSVRREGATFIVEQFYLLEQASGGASTELEEEALSSFISKLLAEGKRVDEELFEAVLGKPKK